MLTMSSALRLISAGLPAPSSTITSYCAASDSYASTTFGTSSRFLLKYSAALMSPSTSPFTITCEPVSEEGLSRMGFMRTDGAIPAAWACTTCARPISSPSSVMKELSAMFCDLKGATE